LDNQKLLPVCIFVIYLLLQACVEEREANQLSPNFTIQVIGAVEEDSIRAIRDALEGSIPRITEELGMTEFPSFVVKVWSDPNEFSSAFAGEGGQGGVDRGYVNTIESEIRVLNGEDVEQIVVHEFAHLATLAVNPTLAQNPIWLWESLALYLDDSGPPDTKTLTCVSESNALSLDDLSRPGAAKVYHVGYFIVDYVLATWDRTALIRLIENNGNIEKSLGIDQEQFERGLHSSLLACHQFGPQKTPMRREQILNDFAGNTLTNENSGFSALLSLDGILYFGANGAVQAKGYWGVSDTAQLCLKLGGDQPRCSVWYQENMAVYLLQSSSDCVLQRWRLSTGDVERFGQ